MTHLEANQLLEALRQDQNLYRVTNSGSLSIWFSATLPAELPVGTEIRRISMESIYLPDHRYWTVSEVGSGWMTFWQHRGPHCSAATAFVSIGPKQSGSAVAQVELVEPLPQTVEAAQPVYGLQGEHDWPYLRKGFVAGLETALADPTADVTVRVLNTISDKVDSSAQAFKLLGQWLVEALVRDMDQRKLVTTP